MAVAPLSLRLFMEGIEIPCIAAQVIANQDQPATAAIQVIPTDLALQLKPRTLVHLFFLDDEVGVLTPSDSSAAPDTHTEPNFEQRRATLFETKDARYKLLFAGEVIGLNYSKTPSSRQLVLQCMDLSSYWDTCYQWFADYSPNGSGLTDKQRNFLGSKSGLFNNITGGHKWVIGRLLNTRPRTPEYGNTKGLLAGLIHLLEAVGGIRYQSSTAKGLRGANDFFTIANLRYNFMGMLGAVEQDTTSARLYASKAFRDWLRNGMTSLGNLLSFRDILNQVNKYIFHNLYPNPCPYYRPGGTLESPVTRPITKKINILTGSPVGSVVIQQIKQSYDALVVARNSFTTAGGEEGEDTTGVPVPASSREAFLRAQRSRQVAGSALDTAIALTEQAGTPDASRVLTGLNTVKEIIGRIETEVGGANEPDLRRRAGVGKELSASGIENLEPLLRPTIQEVTETVRTEDAPRMFTQLVLPEVFFVAPPRCNVLFPDQYISVSYSRNFLREVTRLRLQGGHTLFSEGRGQKLLGVGYYAPNIRDARNNLLLASSEYGGRVLLPHEYHTGIVPRMEWVSSGHRWGVKAAASRGEGAPNKVQYLQRMATFQFFLHRWASRSMQVTCKFNPNLVIGFPALVIDKTLPSLSVQSFVRSTLGVPLMPSQFLGKPVSMTHSINQNGGNTTVTLQRCRTHQSLDDEFVGVLNQRTETLQRDEFTEIIKPKELAASATAGGRRRDALIAMLKLYTSTPNKLVADTRVRQLKAKVVSVTSAGNVSLTPSEVKKLGLGDETLNSTVTDDAGESQQALSIEESITVTLERQVAKGSPKPTDQSVESALTPGWYSDIWGNENIGESVYEPLLGVGSITDTVAASTAEQQEIIKGVVNELEQEGQEGLSEVDNSFIALPGSIEEAIDSIILLYSLVQKRELGVHDFIRQYTKRPIANMENVLGSSNFELDSSGNPTGQPPDMIEGFHSRAFGDYNTDIKFPERVGVDVEVGQQALLGLYPGEGTSPPSIGTVADENDTNPVSPEGDPRGAARARVRLYREELRLSRGLLSA